MNEVLHANIFFIIASVATVIFCVVITLVLFQIYKVVKIARTILEKLETASEVVAEDAANIRQLLASGGFFASIARLFMGQQRRRTRKTKTKD